MVTRKTIETLAVSALESIIAVCARLVDRVHNWAG